MARRHHPPADSYRRQKPYSAPYWQVARVSGSNWLNTPLMICATCCTCGFSSYCSGMLLDLANQTPTPLNLVPPEDIADMGVDYDGNFVCSGGMRVLPVWTSDPQSLCQQSEMQQQPSGNPFDQSSQPQQQPQQQPAQQEQKDSDGVAGWIKDMFGSN